MQLAEPSYPAITINVDIMTQYKTESLLFLTAKKELELYSLDLEAATEMLDKTSSAEVTIDEVFNKFYHYYSIVSSNSIWFN